MRELTKIEKKKYQTQIKQSRNEADSYVFGYRKKEMICDETKQIKTIAKGDPGCGWFVVASCEL